MVTGVDKPANVAAVQIIAKNGAVSIEKLHALAKNKKKNKKNNMKSRF